VHTYQVIALCKALFIELSLLERVSKIPSGGLVTKSSTVAKGPLLFQYRYGWIYSG